MQKFILLIFSALVITFFSAEKDVPRDEKIKWMTLQEAETALQSQKKPILIDLYTDWCGWCKVMDKKTYSNKKVIDYLQSNFYPVKLNAETKEAIRFANKTYNFNNNNRANDIAMYLTYGQLSFPTTVIIPTDNSGPQPVPGYLEPKEIELILKYFGEGKYGKVPFDDYQKGFKASW